MDGDIHNENDDDDEGGGGAAAAAAAGMGMRDPGPSRGTSSPVTDDTGGERDWLGPAFEAREVLRRLFELW
ncbi:hypothetical protein VTH06DRAFT_6728 [Thermothelomyces fergusii]